MLILALRTDKPEAEIYLYNDDKQLAQVKWPAHRELAETLNTKVEEILNKLSISYPDISGVVIYKGPGSFTGLRIGLSVANALAYSLDIPIVALSGEDWIENGAKKLIAGKNDKIALPEYGGPAHITKRRK